jgi:hypothetical protein
MISCAVGLTPMWFLPRQSLAAPKAPAPQRGDYFTE